MRITLFLAFCLSALTLSAQQFPANSGKLRLGFQTTALGLVYYTDQPPSEAPTNFEKDTELVMDSVANVLWQWKGDAWYATSRVIDSLPPLPRSSTNPILDYSDAIWQNTQDSLIYYYEPDLACWRTVGAYMGATAPVNVAATDSTGAVCYEEGGLWYNTTVDSMYAFVNAQWIALGGVTPGGVGVIDSTRILTDSVAVYYKDGAETGRDTIRAGDMSNTNEIQFLGIDFTGDFLTFSITDGNTSNDGMRTGFGVDGRGSQNFPLVADTTELATVWALGDSLANIIVDARDTIGFTGDVGSPQQITNGEFLDLEGGYGVVTTMSTDKANFKIDTTQIATVFALGDSLSNISGSSASNGLSIDMPTGDVQMGGDLLKNTVIQGLDLYDLTFSTIDIFLANSRRTFFNTTEIWRAKISLSSESAQLEFELNENDTLAKINDDFTVDEFGRFKSGLSTIADTPPEAGYIGYNNGTGNYQKWDGVSWSDLGGGGSAFWEDASGVVRTVATSSGLDFVFGSSQLDDSGTSAEDARFFFDNSKGAFYAGQWTGTQADDANRGFNSVNLSRNSTTSAYTSAAIGGENNDIDATGVVAVACDDCISDSGAQNSIVTGQDARTTLLNEHVQGGGGDLNLGHHQFRRLIAWKDHSGTGSAVMHLNGTSTDLVIPNNTAWGGQCECTALVKTAGTGTSVGDHKFYQGRFLTKNIAGSTSIQFIDTTDGLLDSPSFSGSSFSMLADDVNDAVTILINSVPGSGTSVTHFTCVLTITETGY